jgi:hypothetical protein
VKLTVNADGSRGADTKHKVFWVEGCTLPVIPPIIPPITPTDNPTVNTAALPATVLGETLTKPDVTAPATTVLGEQLAAPVGGVQTGGGGTSDSGTPLLPFAAALGFLALAGFVTPRLRRVG